jgi:hypothetical protein
VIVRLSVKPLIVAKAVCSNGWSANPGFLGGGNMASVQNKNKLQYEEII